MIICTQYQAFLAISDNISGNTMNMSKIVFYIHKVNVTTISLTSDSNLCSPALLTHTFGIIFTPTANHSNNHM